MKVCITIPELYENGAYEKVVKWDTATLWTAYCPACMYEQDHGIPFEKIFRQIEKTPDKILSGVGVCKVSGCKGVIHYKIWKNSDL